MEKYSLITNDVETTSLWNHRLSDKTGETVLKEGLPLLLEAYEKYNIKATFFFTGHIARRFPDIVSMVLPYGHEVACHGLVHDFDKAFDVLSYKDQVVHLKQAKDILESICNQEVISFRAPALRVNRDTPKALRETGFKIDSSIASQRFDMFLSSGSFKKIKWLFAPRKPYFTNIDDLSRKGNSNILEIPLSSFILSYTGTIMRISPPLVKFIRTMLHYESSFFNHPVLFLIHPNELIDENIEKIKETHRAKSYIAHLMQDKLRSKIKLRNLGKKALPIFKKELQFFYKNKYTFTTCKDYYQSILNKQ